tara:strand:- start:631 stop:1152 length:522 start_codon:yes stop_codon:yes gene_type:complete
MGLEWADTTIEPKRQFRWTLQFTGLGGQQVPTWVIRTANKPKFSITESSHKYLNHTFYFPGRVEWEEISVTLVDPVTPDASQGLLAMLRGAGYVYPYDQMQGAPVQTIAKYSAQSVIGDVRITQYNQFGGAADEWILKNAWIKSVDFGALDYESDDLVTIDLTLRYDWAETAG